MNMKNIKIIFFDIDGTLIAMDQDTISEKTINHTVEIFSSSFFVYNVPTSVGCEI